MELFHGPTLAFKDVALQLLGRLFDTRRWRSAASASRSSAPPPATPARPRSRPAATATRIDIVILHPQGRTSEVQRRQMTTVLRRNVARRRDRGHVRRLPGPREGDVRRHRASGDELNLSAVNSINWARIAAQIVYYVAAGLALGRAGPAGVLRRADRQFRQRLCRPTGAARWACRSSGWSSAPTANDILARFFDHRRR